MAIPRAPESEMTGMSMGWASHAAIRMNGAMEGRAVGKIRNPPLFFHARSAGNWEESELGQGAGMQSNA